MIPHSLEEDTLLGSFPLGRTAGSDCSQWTLASDMHSAKGRCRAGQILQPDASRDPGKVLNMPQKS